MLCLNQFESHNRDENCKTELKNTVPLGLELI